MDKYFKMADVFGDVVTQKLVGEAYEIMSHSYGHVCVVNTEERADMVAYAINSHDELVAEVERLRESLRWAVGNLPFENAFEWSDDENADAHYAALRLLGVDAEK